MRNINRKIGFLMVLVFVITMLFAVPVFAAERTTLEQAFDTKALTKNVIVDGKTRTDVIVVTKSEDNGSMLKFRIV